MADDNKPVRTFTEQEAYALVADNVSRETAAAAAQVETLTSEKAALAQKLELAEAGLATEKTARETAEQALADFKAQVETEKAQAARKGDRVAKVRETAKHLKDEFFTDDRAARWSAMDDDAFEGYIKELAELSAGVAPAEGTTPPRETAMQGQSVAGAPKGGSLLSALLTGPTKKEA
jgi:chromosome segregation ATPase